MSRVTRITGVIVTDDGEERKFFISATHGRHQWGNSTEQLAGTDDALGAMAEALYEYMPGEPCRL